MRPTDSEVSLAIPSEALRPLVRAVVKEVIEQLDHARQAVPDRAYSEAEAAAYLGVAPHVLRDARLRGEINASRIAGRRIRYTAADVREYLAARRVGG